MSEPRTTRVCVEALGSPLALEVLGVELGEAVLRAWRDAIVPGDVDPQGADASHLTVAVGPWDAADVTGRDIDEVMHRLSPTVTQRAIEARAGELVMLHAAALADPETGATVVLVAPSGTGKTTASTTLGRTLAYLTDETVGVDAEGCVLPYRKPLSIIRSGRLKAQVAASELGLRDTERRCHVSALLVLDRTPGQGPRPQLHDLDNIDAITLLAPQASFLGKLEHPLGRLVDVIERAGGARRVVYSESSTLEPLVSELLCEATR